MKYLIIASFLISLYSCKKTEYFFPNENDYRDLSLEGTWKVAESNVNDSNFLAFTNIGYAGYALPYNTTEGVMFGTLQFIWHNEDSFNTIIFMGETVDAQSKPRRKGTVSYELSENKDTLRINFDINGQDMFNSKVTEYIRNEYQLIYDGPNYVGIEE